MTEHPDAELLSLGHNLELLLKAEALLAASASYDTRHAVSTRTIKVMKAIHRLQPSTMEGVSVKLRALCFDFADFHVENMDLKNGNIAEVQLGRLMRHVQRIAKGKALEAQAKLKSQGRGA